MLVNVNKVQKELGVCVCQRVRGGEEGQGEEGTKALYAPGVAKSHDDAIPTSRKR